MCLVHVMVCRDRKDRDRNKERSRSRDRDRDRKEKKSSKRDKDRPRDKVRAALDMEATVVRVVSSGWTPSHPATLGTSQSVLISAVDSL